MLPLSRSNCSGGCGIKHESNYDQKYSHTYRKLDPHSVAIVREIGPRGSRMLGTLVSAGALAQPVNIYLISPTGKAIFPLWRLYLLVFLFHLD
jgi:hypothetical protein